MKALIVGRWQPFHKGHQFLISQAVFHYDDVCIGIGSSQESRTSNNPLNAAEREEIIRAMYPEKILFKVADKPDCSSWVEAVESKLGEKLNVSEISDEFVAITQNGITQRCFRKGGYQVERQILWNPEIYSGTRIRNMIRKENPEWKGLVPDKVQEILKENEYIEIIRNTG